VDTAKVPWKAFIKGCKFVCLYFKFGCLDLYKIITEHYHRGKGSIPVFGEGMADVGPGNRKRGRSKTVWIDNVTSWTGLKLKDTIRKVENRSAWRSTIRSVAYLRTAKGKAYCYLFTVQHLGMATCAGIS